MSDAYVLDSFALLAYFMDEPGAAKFEELLGRALAGEATFALTTVNMGEIMYTVANRRSMDAAAVAMARMSQWPIEVVPVDAELAFEASHVKATHKMGFLDCFVVALASRRDAALITGDPDFRAVAEVVNIEWLATRHDA